MRKTVVCLVALAVCGALAGWGLHSRARAQDEAQSAETPTTGSANASYDPLHVRRSDEGDAGERLYLRYCSGCHGVKGDGAGPAAPFLQPKPRDFTKGIFKFTTTPANAIPLDEDLDRAILHGLRGTSMPSWRFLPERQRRQLVAYIKTFDAQRAERYPEPAVPRHTNPFDLEEPDEIQEATAQGRLIYHKKATCWQCHPAYIEKSELETLTGGTSRDELNTSIGKEDFWGEVILPPDFARTRLKSVRSLEDLYRVITAGVGGTAMPSWSSALSGEELWALAIYVDSLRGNRSALRRARREE